LHTKLTNYLLRVKRLEKLQRAYYDMFTQKPLGHGSRGAENKPHKRIKPKVIGYGSTFILYIP
jgi:hypothetical protein